MAQHLSPIAVSAHTDPHAAIIADLPTHVWLAADGAPIIFQEALDYPTTARKTRRTGTI